MIITKKALIRLSQLQTKSKTSNYGSRCTLQDLIEVVQGGKPIQATLPTQGLLPGQCTDIGYPVMCLAGCKLLGVVEYYKVIAVSNFRGFGIIQDFVVVGSSPHLIPPTFLNDLPETLEFPEALEHVSQFEPLKTLMGLLS